MSDAAAPARTKVLVVDDSAVIRAVITKTLSACNDIEVIGAAGNGEAGVRSTRAFQPDIVILDIEMPVMDGITALPLILKEKPGVKVLICSTLSAGGADISMKALSLGATECLLKPGGDAIITAEEFQRNLITVVRGLGHATRPRAVSAIPAAPVTLRAHRPTLPPKIVAIGSSTGGPKALVEVLKGLRNLLVPIVITQHMPATFTAMLAAQITDHAGVPCTEGANGTILQPGRAYIAPGGYHMVFRGSGANLEIRLNQEPPECFCRPSVNPMLRSLVSLYGPRVLSVILTGMGSDGLDGSRAVVDAGGQAIAQDEATSVVWGMPGALAHAGLASAILPMAQIAPWIARAVTGAPEKAAS